MDEFTPDMVKAIRMCDSEIPNGRGDVYVCVWMPEELMREMQKAAKIIERQLAAYEAI